LRIFHIFAEKPPWTYLHEILREGSSSRHNQPCQILSQSVQGFLFCGGSNFWLPCRKEKLPLTQGLNYCSACDWDYYYHYLKPVGTGVWCSCEQCWLCGAVIASDDENDAASVLPDLSDDDDEVENSQRQRALVTLYLLVLLSFPCCI